MCEGGPICKASQHEHAGLLQACDAHRSVALSTPDLEFIGGHRCVNGAFACAGVQRWEQNVLVGPFLTVTCTNSFICCDEIRAHCEVLTHRCFVCGELVVV